MNKMSKNTKTYLFLFIIFIIGFITLTFIGFEALSLSICCTILLYIYILLIKNVYRTTPAALFEDGRFYIFTFMFIYSFIVPVYALLSNIGNQSIRLMEIKDAGYYSLDSMIKTVWMSILLFVGIFAGQWIFSRIKFKIAVKPNTLPVSNDGLRIHRYKAKIWFIISIIAVINFLLPFLRGGFSVIASGGSIIDVQNIYASENASFIKKLISMLFGGSIWMYSAIAYIYHTYNSDYSDTRKRRIFLFVIIFCFFIIFATSRRAYAFSIILCCCIMFIKHYKIKNRKYPVALLITMALIFIIIYFAQGVIQSGVSITNMSLAEILAQFDGFGPYDVLLSATKEKPDFTMVSNVFYGIFRNIPLIGKYIVILFGINPDKPPLYLWTAARYSTYSYGGGMACLPQIEAYLSLGYIGCLLFGTVYGAIFAKKHNGLANYYIIAMATTIARGSLQILFGEFWVGVFICYFIYEKVLSQLLISIIKRPERKIDHMIVNSDWRMK